MAVNNNNNNNNNNSTNIDKVIDYIIDNQLCGYKKTWEGDLRFTSQQHYCIYCHKPIEIYKVEYLILGPLDEQKYPKQAEKEKAIPKDAMPILIRRHWNKDKCMDDADFVCSRKCYEALHGSNSNPDPNPGPKSNSDK
jgi:hypothetical protein